MNILGLNLGHDSSAALIRDVIIEVASEEERFNREKHSKAFPFNAINFCLKKSAIDIKNLDEKAASARMSTKNKALMV